MSASHSAVWKVVIIVSCFFVSSPFLLAGVSFVDVVVNSTGDESDGDTTDAVCDTGNSTDGFTGECTFRAAILHLNAKGGTGSISFDLGPGTPKIFSSGLPEVTIPVVITGHSGGADKIVLAGSPGNGSSGLTITGGSSTISDLIIFGFAESGLVMHSGEDNVLVRTWIGLDETESAKPNGKFALFMESGGHVIGCADGPECGNTLDDIGIAFTGGIDILNNRIGTKPDGITSLESKGGISVFSAGFNRIAGNIISGGSGNGISVIFGSRDNVIEENFIGVAADGISPLPNRGDGIHVVGSFDNTISENVISSNGTLDPGFCPSIGSCDGIDFREGSTGNVVTGNQIGTDITGEIAIGNQDNGIFLSSAPGNTIGGTFGEGNTVSGNLKNGVYLELASEFNTITGNIVGLNRAGTAAVGNGGYGVVFAETPANTLGGEDGITPGLCTGVCNVIAGNAMGGVFLDETTAGITVAGNLIGTDVGGVVPMPNGGHGVYIRHASGNIVGPYNVIAHNTGDGVRITETIGKPGDENTITMNGIQTNGGLGIDLNGEGVTPNYNLFSTGANDLMPFPVITTTAETTKTGSAGTRVAGFFNDASRTDTEIVIELFENESIDPSKHGEGGRPLHQFTVTTNDTGFVAFSVELPDVVALVSSTATDDDGNTSEFSRVLLGIVVTQLTDEPDPELEDGQCDVDPTKDGNQCTLRAAIMTANNHKNVPVGDTPIPISFSIEGGCSTCVIKLDTQDLPDIKEKVFLDASTQEGASCSSWPPTLNVVLDGENNHADGLSVFEGGEGSTIRGFVVNRFTESGLSISAEETSVFCNYFGTNVVGNSGKDASGRTGNGSGVLILAGNNKIGDATDLTNRNLFSGNIDYGIEIGTWFRGDGTNEIFGNLIGTGADGRTSDPDGTPGNDDDLGNGNGGIKFAGLTPPTMIGDHPSAAKPYAGNVIAGNGFYASSGDRFEGHGIHITAELNANNPILIRGNRIGVAESSTPADTLARPNQKDGVFIYGSNGVVVGSRRNESAPDGGNLIAFNGGAAVRVASSTTDLSDNNTIRGNSVFQNGFGIDLGTDMVTANDASDQDIGPNVLFNFPVIEELGRPGLTDSLRISYRHSSADGRNPPSIVFDFYQSDRCDATGHGQGERFIGSKTVASGGSSFLADVTFPDVDKCHFITATATDHLGNTSEFSACKTLPSECLVVEYTAFEHTYPGMSEFEFTTETTDGNPNRIIPRIRNISPTDLLATLNVIDTRSGRQLIEEDDRTKLRTFSGKTATELTFDWDTRGFAWPGGSSPGDMRVDVTLFDEAGEKIHHLETPHRVRPRPVVFVHDTWGSISDWEPYTTAWEKERDDWTFSIPSFDLGIAPSISGGPFSLSAAHTPTSIEDHVARLKTKVNDVREGAKATFVDMVGHGAGGVIGRFYIANDMPKEGADPVVSNFAMIGTPNLGSRCPEDFFTITTAPAKYVIGWVTKKLVLNPIMALVAGKVIGDGYEGLHRNSGQNLHILTTSFAKSRLNKEALDQNGVKFYRFAGNEWSVTCSNLFEGGDGSVEFSSQRAAGTPLVFENDGKLEFWNHTTELTSPRIAAQVRGVLETDPEATAKPAENKRSDVPGFIEASEKPVFIGGGPIPVLPSETTALPVPIRSASAFGVTIMGAGITSRLVDGSGAQIDSLLTSSNSGGFRTHVVLSPQAGDYILELSHSSAQDTAYVPVFLWAYGTDRELRLQVEPPGPGLELPVTATFLDGMATVSGASVGASLVPVDAGNAANGSVDFDLFDDGLHGDGAAGDGIYGNTSAGVPAGVYTLSVWGEDDVGVVAASTTVDLGEFVAGNTMDLEINLDTDPETDYTMASTLFTASVTNRGTAGATGTIAVIELAEAFLPSGMVTSKGTCTTSGVVVACDLGEMGAGETASIDVSATILVAESVRTVSVATISAVEPDWNGSNDRDEAVTTLIDPNVANENGVELPTISALHAGYPNPFNPSVSIPYDVASPSHVTVDVYNALGQKVDSLVDRFLPAGRYTASFDGTGLPSGVYLVRATMADFVATTAVSLLK